jgi:hypothetical protein
VNALMVNRVGFDAGHSFMREEYAGRSLKGVRMTLHEIPRESDQTQSLRLA